PSAGYAGTPPQVRPAAALLPPRPPPAASPSRAGPGRCTTSLPRSPYTTIANYGSPPICVQLASSRPSALGYDSTAIALSSATRSGLRGVDVTAVTACGWPSTSRQRTAP